MKLSFNELAKVERLIAIIEKMEDADDLTKRREPPISYASLVSRRIAKIGKAGG